MNTWINTEPYSRWYGYPIPEFTWNHCGQLLCTLETSHLKCPCFLASFPAIKRVCSAYVQGSQKSWKLMFLRQLLSNEGWESMNKYSSFAIPQWDNSEGCFLEGPQEDRALATHSGNQLIDASFTGIPPFLALLSPLAFLGIIFPIKYLI